MDAVYQDKILAYAKACRNRRPLGRHTHSARLANPVCGDRVDVELVLSAAGLSMLTRGLAYFSGTG